MHTHTHTVYYTVTKLDPFLLVVVNGRLFDSIYSASRQVVRIVMLAFWKSRFSKMN